MMLGSSCEDNLPDFFEKCWSGEDCAYAANVGRWCDGFRWNDLCTWGSSNLVRDDCRLSCNACGKYKWYLY